MSLSSGRKRRRKDSESSEESSALSTVESDHSDDFIVAQRARFEGEDDSRDARIKEYARSYQGYSSGIIRDFCRWVVEQDLIRVSKVENVDSFLAYRQSTTTTNPSWGRFTTFASVNTYMYNRRSSFDWASCPKLYQLFHGVSGVESLGTQSSDEADSSSARLVDTQV